MQDGDIIFNLRLMNQKMEEELRLYRNGTTPDNLLDLIDEKDAEISRLRKVSADSADKLRRIAKGSKDVIAKCDQLQKENEELKCLEAKRSTADAHTRATQQKQKQKQSTLSSSSKEITAAKQSIAELAQEVLALQAENETLNNSMDLLVPEADKYQELIEELEDVRISVVFLLSIACCLLPVACCLLSVVCCLLFLLSVVCCLLPDACFLLPAACYLLSAVFCLLSILYCMFVIVMVIVLPSFSFILALLHYIFLV